MIMKRRIQFALLLLVCSGFGVSPAAADWKLVFEDDFKSLGDPLATWQSFGDATSLKKGRRGKGLLLRGPGGSLPAYSGAVLGLGGGIKPDNLVRAKAKYRTTSKVRAGAGTLALKLEYFDRADQPLGVEETTVALDAESARRWNDIEVLGRVPAGTARTQLALVLIQERSGEPCEVMVDDVEAERRNPPPDHLSGTGGFEASDGGAVGWTVFNNISRSPAPRGGEGYAMKAWGPFSEPYAGSVIERRIPIPNLKQGEQIKARVRAVSTSSDSIEGTGNLAILRVECVNQDGVAIAHKESRPLDPAQSPMTSGVWSESEVVLDMPKDTRSIRYVLAFIQPTTESGSIFFDDASLVRDSEPDRELLDNGDFETASTGVPGWESFGDAAMSNEQKRGGTAGVRMRGTDGGDPSGIVRSVPGVVGGDSIKVEAWSMVPSSASIRGTDGKAVLKLEYLDRSGRIKGSKILPLQSGDEVGAEDAWKPNVLETRVPTGVSGVQVAAVMTQSAGGSGEVWIDDVTIGPARERNGRSSGIEIPIANGGFDGGVPDPAKWNVADGAWSHNRELQYYAPDSVRVERGRMIITAENRPIGDREYSSAHVSTENLHEQKYGRWEIRAKLPTSQGMWPAIWLLPSDGSWPPEIDIIELVGKEPNTVHHSYHWGPLRDGLNPWDLGQSAVNKTSGMNFRKSFHDFAVEWTPQGITWFVDGQPVHHHAENLPDAPMYLIINTAIGGFWPGSPGENTRWPETMEIDQVRIYRWTGAK